MGKKIDYTKVEQQLQEALIRMQVDQLIQGKPITSKNAQDYYGLGDETPRPVQEDAVMKLIAEGLTDEEQDPEEEISPDQDQMKQAPKRNTPPQTLATPLPKAIPKETYDEPISDLMLLRRHIFWMKQQAMNDRYELLGTTQEEVFALRRKERLSPEDKLRIRALLQKAKAVREEIIEDLGAVSDDTLIQKEKKRHLTKRFNVREKWIPL